MKHRINRLIQHMQQGLVEREEPVKLALLAALAGEHMLLLGPPGTAKSELARRLKSVFDGGDYFERLLTKFSVPEELFGPLSIKALEQDEYRRLTEYYLPSASIAFLDEIFKANSAILNALLTLLNEREFDNGAQRFKTPLIAVIAASNELPEGDELDALYDRFLIRYQVEGVSDDGFGELLQLDDLISNELSADLKLTRGEILSVQTSALQLSLDDEVVHLLKSLRGYLREQGISISDRRWRKAIKLLKVAAYTDGRSTVTVWDCWLLQHCLWDTPEKRKTLVEWYERHLGTDAVLNPERLQRLSHTWAETLKQESEAVHHLKDTEGRLLYFDFNGVITTDSHRQHKASLDGEALYLAPPDQNERDNAGNGYTLAGLKEQFFDDHYQQCHIDGHWVTLEDYTKAGKNRLITRDNYPAHTEQVCYSDSHIRDRVKEVESLFDSVANYRDSVTRKLDHIDEKVVSHLWIEDGFVEPARQNLGRSLDVAVTLSQQIEEIRDGFSRLPLQ